MKPLELRSVAAVWRSSLALLAASLEPIGEGLQLWFPWGDSWRGQDERGSLPPTDLPRDLVQPSPARFAGRAWKTLPEGGVTWLVSLHVPEERLNVFHEWGGEEQIRIALRLLTEFIRLECLLGMTLKILENRASEHIGHWDRVRHFCVSIGRDLQLADAELVDLELAGLLHDIGKVGLPSSILEGTQPLTMQERKVMETHSVVGAGMVREIPGFERVAEYVHSHHEAMDGSGYPRGLKGDEIPLLSRIIAVADAFDAMTHYRPYAEERTYQESVRELTQQTGKFDIRVLQSLQQVLRDLGILESTPRVPGPLS